MTTHYATTAQTVTDRRILQQDRCAAFARTRLAAYKLTFLCKQKKLNRIIDISE